MRKAFNASFTEEKYQEYLKELNAPHPGQLEFRIAETPVFCDKAFTEKMTFSLRKYCRCNSVAMILKRNREKAIPAECECSW